MESFKEMKKVSSDRSTTNDLWLSYDQLLSHEGWDESTPRSLKSQRAKTRTDAIVAHCGKFKKGWMRTHPQHGDWLYRVVTYVDSRTKDTIEELRTHFGSKGDLEKTNTTKNVGSI